MIDPLAATVFFGHLTATLFMVGVIWFVQVVHYPLMGMVGAAEAIHYERQHTRRTGWVVGPAMLIEAGTAVALVWVRPDGVDALQVWVGLGLLAVAWASTWLVQVPCHERLSRAFDPATHRRLVQSNWLRTAVWTARGAIALWMVYDVSR